MTLFNQNKWNNYLFNENTSTKIDSIKTNEMERQELAQARTGLNSVASTQDLTQIMNVAPTTVPKLEDQEAE